MVHISILLTRPDDNPFRYLFNQSKEKRQQLAATLFDCLSRLIIALLLMEIPFRKKAATVDPTATDALSETEQHVLTAIHQWGELFKSVSQPSKQALEGQEQGADKELRLEETSLQLIEELTSTLTELRGEMKKVLADTSTNA